MYLEKGVQHNHIYIIPLLRIRYNCKHVPMDVCWGSHWNRPSYRKRGMWKLKPYNYFSTEYWTLTLGKGISFYNINQLATLEK